jgi:hypothetical protein
MMAHTVVIEINDPLTGKIAALGAMSQSLPKDASP